MHIERKRISDTEIILYFSAPLSVVGSLYADKTNKPSSLPFLLQNIFDTPDCSVILLTQDFLYLKSTNKNNLEDVELAAIAEIDDYASASNSQEITDLSISTDKIELILKTAVAPFLQKDGGDISLKYCKDNIAYVHFLGKCNGCPYAQKTLKERVEKTLIRYLPQIREAVLI